MRALTSGMSGEDVKNWQKFLLSQSLYRGEVTGQFNDETRQATIDFQRLHELLPAEGLVTNRTLGMAMVLGLTLFDEPTKKGGD